MLSLLFNLLILLNNLNTFASHANQEDLLEHVTRHHHRVEVVFIDSDREES